MSDHSQREWRFYVDDMLEFAEKVLSYTEGLDQAGFVASGLTYDATLRNLELLVRWPHTSQIMYAMNTPIFHGE